MTVDPRWEIKQGDALTVLRTMADESVHCCVTSPPYYHLRDYQIDGQIGLEKTPEEFVDKLVEVFREVRRVLHPSGLLFLNLGDSYAGSWGNQSRKKERGKQRPVNGNMIQRFDGWGELHEMHNTGTLSDHSGLKPKDLIGVPWMVAFALRKDGWWLRSDIIVSKKNPMPESIEDRPTKSHEYLFMLSKNQKYFYDSEAVKEAASNAGKKIILGEKSFSRGQAVGLGIKPSGNGNSDSYIVPNDRNLRSVWTVTTMPFKESHFATMPPKLVEPCVKAGTSEHGCCPVCLAPWKRVVEKKYERHENWFGDKQDCRHSRGSAGNGYNELVGTTTTGWQPTCKCEPAEPIPCTVLDPFAGAGTTLLVALRLSRSAVGIELNPKYIDMARRRIISDAPMFNTAAEVRK